MKTKIIIFFDDSHKNNFFHYCNIIRHCILHKNISSAIFCNVCTIFSCRLYPLRRVVVRIETNVIHRVICTFAHITCCCWYCWCWWLANSTLLEQFFHYKSFSNAHAKLRQFDRIHYIITAGIVFFAQLWCDDEEWRHLCTPYQSNGKRVWSSHSLILHDEFFARDECFVAPWHVFRCKIDHSGKKKHKINEIQQ